MFLPYRAVQQEVGLEARSGHAGRRTTARSSPRRRICTSTLLSFLHRPDLNENGARVPVPGYLPIALAIPALVLGGLVLARASELPDVSRRTMPSVARFKAVYAVRCCGC